MLKGIAHFEKVSKKQFNNDWIDTFGNTPHESVLEDIVFPQRATIGSAGYDFVSPIEFTLKPGEEIKIPTGIRCKMLVGWLLFILPRSGLGFKYKVRLYNTIGLIDSDYYTSENEGHIFVKIANEGNKTMTIKRGERFCQGVFLPYGITIGDTCDGYRNGGMGSTGKE